jgi:O-antigen ligase
MRRQWIEGALRGFLDRPLAGHGVATLRDTTPESRRMGTYGARIWPHNDMAEAAFSLGIVGLVPFLLLVGASFVALFRLRSAVAEDMYLCILGLFLFAFLESNFSGEIGTDALLWGSSALILAFYTDWRAAPSRTGSVAGERPSRPLPSRPLE